MKYVHQKTGAVILTDSVLAGDWEIVSHLPKNDVVEDYTVAELKQMLDELGVAYDPKAKKAELLALYQANQ